MSLLFTPLKIGNLEILNRLVCSATYEGMARENGEVSDELIKRYVTLSKGEVGLSITGMMYVQSSGRGYKYQLGIHDDKMTDGLKKLVGMVHREKGKIVFQIAHCGRQTTKSMAGQTPLGPSSRGRDPLNFVKPKEMTENEIKNTIYGKYSAIRGWWFTYSCYHGRGAKE